MLTDGLRFLEGSTNTNLVLPVVTSAGKAALSANAGEVVFQSDGTKGLYVYDGIQWVLGIDISAASSPIAASRLPAFTGDVTSTAGTSALTLAASGVTAGTFKSVTVNAKGLVTAGTNPTTLSGYGISDAYTKSQVDTALTNATGGVVTFAAVTAKPTTISGYGILDAYTKSEVDTAITNATPVLTFASLTGKPTTLAGYGITDSVLSTDVRLTDARTPLAHTHVIADVTDLQTSLDAKVIKNADIVAGTAFKITYDAKGLVTAGAALTSTDIPALSTDAITSGVFDATRLPADVVYTVAGALPSALVPTVSLTGTITPNTYADLTAATAASATGTVGIVTADSDLTKNGTYVKGTDGTWKKLNVATNNVASINGKTGNIAKILPEDILGVFDTDVNKTLLSAKMPLFTGDVVSTSGARSTLTLNTIPGLTVGANYSSVTVNAKGLVTGGIVGNNYTTVQADAKFVTKTAAGEKNAANGYLGLNATGKIEATYLPLFDGDVASTAGARNILTLKNISGLAAGTYSSVTVNAKGLVTGGTNGVNYTKVEADAKFLTKAVAGGRNVAEGFAGLNSAGKIDATLLPAITVNEIQSVTTIVERDALTGLSVGDMAIVGGSVNKTFILSSVSPNTWVELLNPVGGVTSINGNSGVVTIDLSNIPGTLAPAKMPVYTTGDVVTNVVSNDLELKTVSGLTAGSYSKVTVNTKGIVTAGTNPTTLAGYGITDAVTPADITTAIDNIKASVPTDGDNLKKLYDLIVASFKEIVVADIAARDLYDVTALPTNVFVNDDGDGKWALYKATTTGVGATFVKLSDPDLLNTAVAFTPENVADKSIDGTLAENSDTKYPSQKAVKTYADTKVTKNTDIVAGTGTKITYDEKGLVTVGEQLTATDIPALSTDKITSGVFDTARLPVDLVYTVNGALPSNLLPTVSLTGTITPNTYADMTAATAATGTVAIVTADSDLTKNATYVKGTDGAWKKLNVATNNVASINGKTGNLAKILPEDISGVFDTDVNKTLLSSKLPLFTGDVVSTSGARNTLTLNTIPGLTAGASYASVTVNAKGLVTAGVIGTTYTTTQADAKFVTKLVAGEKNAANGYLGLNATGIIDSLYLPLFEGDVTSTSGAKNTLTLKTMPGLAAGSYSSVNVNTKGLVTGGIVGENYTKVESDAKFLTKAISGGRNVAEGFVGLNASSKIDSAFLPAITVNQIQSVATILARDALTGLSVGDMAIVGGSVNKTFILTSVSPNTWVEMLNPTGGVTSVNGSTGVVNIDLSNIPGTLTVEKMPIYTTGDVVTNSVSKDLELKVINGLTAGSYSKVTVNTKGIITAGAQLAATDIPNLSWNKIATDKPTTLTGFGIVDAYTKAQVDTAITNATPTLTFTSLTGKPTDIAGYGITDAYTKTEVDTAITNATPVLTFASLTGKPTTLAGYGITDTVATLENGKIPSSQLPSFVDDVQEFANLAAFPAPGETGKIYVALDTNLTWRWSGSVYLQVSGPTTDASVLVGGTLAAARLPAFTGDVTSTAGTNTLTLANSGVTAGTYNSVTVNAKGIVTAAAQSAASKDLSTARTITLSENLMLTDTSKHIQTIITTQPGLEVILPDATNFPIGGIHFVIKNDGYMTFNVADRIGNWICEVRPSSSVAVLLSNNTKNQYNYTENSVVKSGYAGEWVTVIGNATRPSGLIIGDETRLVSSTITNVGATPLSLTKAIVTYVTGNVAYVALLSNSQLVNTIATPVSLGAVTNSTIQIEALSSSIALVTYQTSAGVKVSKLSYDGTTLTVASTATVYNNTALDHKLVKVSTTSAVVSYVDATNALKLLTISDALTLGTVNNFGTIGNEFDITFNNNKLLLVYLDTNLKSSVGTISSGVITFGASTDVTAYAVSKIHLISTDTNANLCAFYHSTGFVEYVQLTMDTYDVNSVSTNVIFVGDIVKVKGAYVSDIALTSTYNKNVVLSYKTTNGKLEIVDITINANTVSVNNINTLVNSNGGTVEVIALYEDSIICVYSGLYDFLYVV